MKNFRKTLTFIFLMYFLLIVGCTAIFVIGNGNNVNTDHDLEQSNKVSVDSNTVEIDSNKILNFK